MKKFLMILCVWLCMAGICMAQSVELALDAGSKSINASGAYRKNLGNGYMKIGLSGLYTDDDDTQYQWGSVGVVAGNDTFIQGLSCEIGLNAILGDAETDEGSGDVGALAFTIRAGYLFPEHIMPLPLEIFSKVSHAPSTLSFADTDQYTEVNVGIGIHIIKNASVNLTYTIYNIDMENGPGDWSLDENVIRAGIAMRF